MVILALLLLLANSALGEDVRVKVQAFPPDAGVYRQTSKDWDYLGPVGETLNFSVERSASTVFFAVRADGYREQKFTLSTLDLIQSEESVWPPDGEATLEASSVGVRLVDFVRYRPLRALGLTVLVFVVGGMALRRRRDVGGKLERAQRLEQYAEDAKDEAASLVMHILGGYRLVSVLGRGGMATVYRAVPEEDLNEAQEVACKVIRREYSQDPEHRARFEREIAVCKQLNHPGIVRLVNWGDHEGMLFLTMEVVKGKTLRERIDEGLSDEESAAMLVQIFDAVAYAHDQRVVHRDLKPENIMVTDGGKVKIMDFGLARAHDTATITGTATALGTPKYMAPEQIQSRPPSALADQYSLGVIAYEMLVGQHPFQEEDPLQFILKHLSEAPPTPTGVRSDLPEELDGVLLRMMAKEGKDRYPDLKAARSALEAALWGGA